MSVKTPLSRSLPQAIQAAIRQEVSRLGRALPARVTAVSGAIVTVAFEVADASLPQVTVPLFGPEYIRYPVQVGDKGFCIPADAYLGGVSGLGGGTAQLGRRMNLSTLVFFPIGNKGWSSVDPDAVTIYGPNGVVLRDTNGHTTATLTPSNFTIDSSSGALSFTINGCTLTMDSSGITISFSGNEIVIDSTGVQIMGKYFMQHEHTGVQTGSGVSGPVSP